jgi:hypothetical protein
VTDQFRAIVNALSPAEVSQFLKARGWLLSVRHPGVREIWRLEGDGGDRASAMLPLDTNYVDYPQAFVAALHTIGVIYDWSPLQLVEHVMDRKTGMANPDTGPSATLADMREGDEGGPTA